MSAPNPNPNKKINTAAAAVPVTELSSQTLTAVSSRTSSNSSSNSSSESKAEHAAKQLLLRQELKAAAAQRRADVFAQKQRDAAAAATPPITIGLHMLRYKGPPSSWTCPARFIRNVAKSSKCVSCETDKPEAGAAAAPAAAAPVTTSFDMSTLSGATGGWHCGVRFVRNDAKSSKYQSCETAKFAVKAASDGGTGATQSSTAAKPTAGAFGAGGFYFGAPTATSAVTSSTGITAGDDTIVAGATNMNSSGFSSIGSSGNKPGNSSSSNVESCSSGVDSSSVNSFNDSKIITQLMQHQAERVAAAVEQLRATTAKAAVRAAAAIGAASSAAELRALPDVAAIVAAATAALEACDASNAQARASQQLHFELQAQLSQQNIVSNIESERTAAPAAALAVETVATVVPAATVAPAVAADFTTTASGSDSDDDCPPLAYVACLSVSSKLKCNANSTPAVVTAAGRPVLNTLTSDSSSSNDLYKQQQTVKQQPCVQCGKLTKKRCRRCQAVYYCS
jgi:hypothetical protein